MCFSRPFLLALLISSRGIWAGESTTVDALDFRAEALAARFEALEADVEESLGEPLGGKIEFVPATRAAAAKVIAAENAAILAEVEGGPRGAALRRECRRQAKVHASILLAKYDPAARNVLVIGENFEAQAALLGEDGATLLSPEFLDVILVHESIHFFQDRKYGLLRSLGKPHSQEEFMARLCASEGHAQFVVRKVAEKRKLAKHLALLDKIATEVPPSIEDPAERMVLEIVQHIMSFSRVEGPKFFAAIEKELGYAKALARVFDDPPLTLRVVSHPREYLHPVRAGLDLRKLLENARDLYDPARYQVQIVVAPETALRQACALAGKEAVDKGFAAYRNATIAVGSARQGVAGSQLIISVFEFESAAGAAAFLELEKTVSLKKDAQFKEPGGLAQIVAAEYAEAGGAGSGGFYADKKLKLRFLEEELSVRTLVIGRERFVIEVGAVYVPAAREDLEALARKITDLLDAASRAPAEPPSENGAPGAQNTPESR